MLPNEKEVLLVSAEVVVLEDCFVEPNSEVGGSPVGLGPPKIENGSLLVGAASSESSSIDSLSEFPSFGVDTMSSNDPPNENAPEEGGLSDFGRSLTAVPSPLKLDLSWNPPNPAPKGFFTPFAEGVAKDVSDLGFSKAEPLEKAFSPEAGLANGDSSGLATPKALCPVAALANGASSGLATPKALCPVAAFANGDWSVLATPKAFCPVA